MAGPGTGLAVPMAGHDDVPRSELVMPGPGAAVSGVAGDASRRASALAITVLVLILAARLFDVLHAGQGGQVPFTVALFVLPLLYAVPATWPLLSRHRWLVLAVQGVLTWMPFAVFGSAWQIGIGGLLAGLVLLMMPGRVPWLLAGGLLVAEVVVRATMTGLPTAPAWYGVIKVVTYYVDDALEFFAMVRLSQIVVEVEQARAAAAGLAVAGERLQAARDLQAAIGERLAGIGAMAAAAQQALSRDAARARAQIAAAGAAARDAVAQARQMTVRQRGAVGPESLVPPSGGAVIAARLAWAVLVVVLLAYATDSVADVVASGYGARLTALVVTDIVLVTALQLHHSWSVRGGGKPRAWPVTLGLQAVLVYAFLFPFVAAYVGALAPFLAGSVLLLVPGRWRWAGYAAVMVSWPVLSLTIPQRGITDLAGQRVFLALLLAAEVAVVGLVVYGLARLAALARELEALHGELARVAVVAERLRIARDVHDLLGLGLSAAALKADLAGALIGGDDARAAAELGELGRICAASRADIRRVTGEGQQLSLAAELSAARQILASAGIGVRADIPAGPLPAVADQVLATVLREAVTNILRHSTATTCTIEARPCDRGLQLRVANDGAQPTVVGGPPGSGLANLTARVQAVGGLLASRQADGTFDLVAEIPLPAPPG
jgi:two-component system sensor histidine kinase DesK